MHTLRIKVKDSVYDQFQHFLEKLPKDDIQVLADDLIADSSERVIKTGNGKGFIEKWSGILLEDCADYSRIDYLTEKYK